MKTTVALIVVVLNLAVAPTLTFADTAAEEEGARGRNGRLRKWRSELGIEFEDS